LSGPKKAKTGRPGKKGATRMQNDTLEEGRLPSLSSVDLARLTEEVARRLNSTEGMAADMKPGTTSPLTNSHPAMAPPRDPRAPEGDWLGASTEYATMQPLAPPGPGTATAPPRPSILELAEDVLQDPRAWLDTPNSQLGGRRPNDLIGTDEEEKVYHLLKAVDLGLF
jgi:hypothetical protein